MLDHSDDEDEDFEEIARRLMNVTEVMVRVYILDGWDLEAKDDNSPSDPYLRIKLGSTVINDSANYILDTYTPQFFKHFDI